MARLSSTLRMLSTAALVDAKKTFLSTTMVANNMLFVERSKIEIRHEQWVLCKKQYQRLKHMAFFKGKELYTSILLWLKKQGCIVPRWSIWNGLDHLHFGMDPGCGTDVGPGAWSVPDILSGRHLKDVTIKPSEHCSTQDVAYWGS